MDFISSSLRTSGKTKMSHQRISTNHSTTTQLFKRLNNNSISVLRQQNIDFKLLRWKKYPARAHGNEEGMSGESLAAEFSQYLLEHEIAESKRKPSHLMSPAAVVSAQMNALQRKDWPEFNDGIRTAFEFTKPQTKDMVTHADKRVRAWFAKEEWLTFEEFTDMLNSESYTALVHFDEWEAISKIVFPSKRLDVAVQAVKITTQSAQRLQEKRSLTYTFCLEKILEGSYRNCWLTVGVRFGDYSK